MGLAFRDKRVRLIGITARSAETGFRVKTRFSSASASNFGSFCGLFGYLIILIPKNSESLVTMPFSGNVAVIVHFPSKCMEYEEM